MEVRQRLRKEHELNVFIVSALCNYGLYLYMLQSVEATMRHNACVYQQEEKYLSI